jgi:hypothetical protein
MSIYPHDIPVHKGKTLEMRSGPISNSPPPSVLVINSSFILPHLLAQFVLAPIRRAKAAIFKAIITFAASTSSLHSSPPVANSRLLSGDLTHAKNGVGSSASWHHTPIVIQQHVSTFSRSSLGPLKTCLNCISSICFLCPHFNDPALLFHCQLGNPPGCGELNPINTSPVLGSLPLPLNPLSALNCGP